jgi:hypothetical protein
MTVYIVQQPRPNKSGWTPDLSSSAKYGPLEYIFDSSEKVYALPGPSLFKARKILRNFNPEEDYFLWPNVGDPMACIISTIALAERNIDFFRILYWDRKREVSGERKRNEGFYIPIKISLKER